MIDVPSGLRDLIIDGMDVDVKNTVRSTWTIPPETYLNEEPCLLIRSNEATNRCWLGLFFARDRYLTPGKNRDAKRAVSAFGRQNILWMLDDMPYPQSRWLAIDPERFREIRKIKGGSTRAATFFRENIEMRVHRTIVQALLYDQYDYMKRLRGNGGARDILKKDGIALLSGMYDSDLIGMLSLPTLSNDEHVAYRPRSPETVHLLQSRNLID